MTVPSSSADGWASRVPDERAAAAEGDYVWVAGHWERARAGRAWTEGRWEQQGDRYVWIAGGWR